MYRIGPLYTDLDRGGLENIKVRPAVTVRAKEEKSPGPCDGLKVRNEDELSVITGHGGSAMGCGRTATNASLSYLVRPAIAVWKPSLWYSQSVFPGIFEPQTQSPKQLDPMTLLPILDRILLGYFSGRAGRIRFNTIRTEHFQR